MCYDKIRFENGEEIKDNLVEEKEMFLKILNDSITEISFLTIHDLIPILQAFKYLFCKFLTHSLVIIYLASSLTNSDFFSPEQFQFLLSK